jgi:hypothetical protein
MGVFNRRNGIMQGDGNVAHHLVTVEAAGTIEFRTFFKRAANEGWDLNARRNGIVLDVLTEHPNNHPVYNAYINTRISSFISSKGGINQISGIQAKRYLNRLSSEMSTYIQANRGQKITDLFEYTN